MKIICLVIIIICVICLVSSIIDTHRFVVRHYEYYTGKVDRNLRIVLISDLHNKDYGRDNSTLLSAIEAEKPDLVIIAGDLLNGNYPSGMDNAKKFALALASRYQVYYGMGNHESRVMLYPVKNEEKWEPYGSELADAGVHLLDNAHEETFDASIDIAGLSLDRKYYRKLKGPKLSSEDITELIGPASDERLQILIAHNPDYFETYCDWGADLIFSGHIHGGIMRLPLIKGVISPRFTLFPKYSGGEYTKGTSKMVVSCGLGMHTINIRVFNPGELSVIDIHRQ